MFLLLFPQIGGHSPQIETKAGAVGPPNLPDFLDYGIVSHIRYSISSSGVQITPLKSEVIQFLVSLQQCSVSIAAQQDF